MTKPDITSIPQPADTTLFRVGEELMTRVLPHPYMIGTKHLSLNEGMYLDIEATEKKGAQCYWKEHGVCCTLKYHEHVTEYVLQIVVKMKLVSLDTVLGLHDYLMSIKDEVEKLGIAGFAFPTEAQYAAK